MKMIAQEKEQDPGYRRNRHYRNGFRPGDLHGGGAAGGLECTIDFVVTASLIQQVRVLYHVSDFLLGRVGPLRGSSVFQLRGAVLRQQPFTYFPGLPGIQILKRIIDNVFGFQRK